MKNFDTLLNRFDRYAEQLLFIACSVMTLMFLSFVFVVSQTGQSQAQQSTSTTVCKGENLISRFKETDPAKLAKIQAEADKTINGHSVFWKIEKDALPASYLLGTMHMADERIARLEGKKAKAFDASNTVIVENIEALDPAQASAAMLAHKDMTLYTDGTTLADRLDPETLEKLKLAAKQRDIPFAVAQIMQPWLVATSVALPACELQAKRSGAPVLDALIANRAKNSGKELVGLETITEQFSAMYKLPEAFHLAALKETLDMGDQSQDVIETMKELYLAGKVDMIQPLTKVLSPKTSGTKDFEDFNTSLITDRNKLMAERAMPYLEKGSVFIAVGALHLPGETGLVQAFKHAGFTLTPMPAE